MHLKFHRKRHGRNVNSFIISIGLFYVCNIIITQLLY